MSGSVRSRSTVATLAAVIGLLLVTACASGQNYDTHTTSPSGIGLGTGAGAAAGALAGRAIAGKHDNTLAMVGGALLGGLAGNMAVDRPNQLRGQDETAAAAQAQRLLTGLGYYRGPIDGVYGGGTRSAIMQFESSQGLPRTGYLTPSLVQSMKATI